MANAFLSRLGSLFKNEQRQIVGPFSTLQELSSFLFVGENSSGEDVSVKKSTRIDTVFSCINALSQDIAKLPFQVRQDTDKGKVVLKNNIYKLIHDRPNQFTGAFNFWYEMVFHMLSFGNGFAYILRDENAKILGIYSLKPDEVEVYRYDNEVFYRVNGKWVASYDILHFKLYSFDGITGVSPLVYNAETMGYRLKQDKYKTKVLGQKPPGVLSFDQHLNQEQIKQNRESWQSQVQGDNLGGTPVLFGGAKYQPLMLQPDEGQMIESMELNDEKIMGIYRVPPTIIQNYKRATFSNAEHQDLIYSKYAITPIAKVIEDECNYKLFSERQKREANPPYVKINIKAMLRGDIKTQVEYYRFLRSWGLASADEIRELEDMPPLPDNLGKMVTIQGANIPLDMLKEFYSSEIDATQMPNSEEGRQIGYKMLMERMRKLETQNKYEEGLH